MPELSFPSPRRRGAPKGNLNALKHGFYSRRFRKSDLTDLDAHEFAGLKDEITLLRVYMRRVVEQSIGNHEFYDSMALLRILCLASDSLTRLLKAQAFLVSTKDETTELILQAIDEVNEEMLKRRATPPPTSSSPNQPAASENK